MTTIYVDSREGGRLGRLRGRPRRVPAPAERRPAGRLQDPPGRQLSVDCPLCLYGVDAALGTLNWAYTGARLAAWISSNFATATYSKTTNSLSVAYDGNPPRRPPLRPSPSAWTTLGPSFVSGRQQVFSGRWRLRCAQQVFSGPQGGGTQQSSVPNGVAEHNVTVARAFTKLMGAFGQQRGLEDPLAGQPGAGRGAHQCSEAGGQPPGVADAAGQPAVPKGVSVLAGTYDDTVRNIDIGRAGYLRHSFIASFPTESVPKMPLSGVSTRSGDGDALRRLVVAPKN